MQAVIIVGPTASGKTGLSLKLAGSLFEIISADSVQVYKYMDIGSGKPDPDERNRVRHYLIDYVEPDYPFTTGEFCREARKAAEEIVQKERVPLIVGGTGLYIDSLLEGLSDIPEISPIIREQVKDDLDKGGIEALYQELEKVDRVFASKVHPNDRQRIIRGLEVYRGTGRALSGYFGSRDTSFSPGRKLYIGLYIERAELVKRIEDRVDRMMKCGFVDEVRSLRERGFGPELKSMKSIGYAEIHQYLDGKMDYDETVEKIKVATRRYAKRQMTWFRKNKVIHWHKPEDISGIGQLVDSWLANLN